MATKENFLARLTRVKTRAAQAGQSVLDTPMLSRTAEAGICFLLAAVLAGGEILGSYSPFALALVAASGSGIDAFCALAGASFGYLTLLGMGSGLRYVSAAILTFAAAFAFYDVRFFKLPWTMPLIAAGMNAFTGVVYLSQRGWTAEKIIGFSTEVVLTALSAYGFQAVLAGDWKRPGRRARCRLGWMLLGGAVLAALSKLYLFADVSLGRALAACGVLCCAWQGGIGSGAVAGVGLGLALDLAAGGTPLYAMAYGAAGLCAGLLRGKRRLTGAVSFVLADAGAVLWTWHEGASVAVLYEVFAASVVFLILPDKLVRTVGSVLAREEGERVDGRTRDRLRIHLEKTAGAFRTLYQSLRSTLRAPAANDGDTAVVFDRTADQVCRKCSLRGTCWERDYVTTFNALNDAMQAMMDRGRGEAGDFPPYFSSRCIHFPLFLESVNRELTGLLYRRQYNRRIQDSRQAVCQQYEQLSTLLDTAAAELGEELVPDLPRERKLRAHIAAQGVKGECSVYQDRRRRLHIQIGGPACARMAGKEQLNALSALMGVPLRIEGKEAEERLDLIQAEPLMALAGVAARRKDGETVSGDAGTWFKRPDGTLYVLLCDGMGSGMAANRESSLAIRLLEQFLQAGVEAENALIILNSALALRGEAEGGFTTVDLLQLDLYTGQASIYKLGAAPTYMKKGRGVQRFAGSSLPAGLATAGGSRPDCTHIKLEPGDCVLMVSDGVCGGQDDAWLRQRLEDFDGVSPKELARGLVTDGPDDPTDDRTALVVRVEKRGKGQKERGKKSAAGGRG